MNGYGKALIKKIRAVDKLLVTVCLIIALCSVLLSACGSSASGNTSDQDSSEQSQAIEKEDAESQGEQDMTGGSQGESEDDSQEGGNDETSSQSSGSITTVSVDVSAYDGFTERDFNTGYSDYVTITLKDGGSQSSGKGVTIDGDTVTITSEGTYLLTGELSDGQVVVDLPGDNDKVQLVLDGVKITNSSSAGIYVKNADKVFVTTTNGSDNRVETTGTYVQTDDNNVDGAIFSKDDIVFNGNGTLTVTSAEGHGIVSKNDLKITGGRYVINAAKKGLQGKDMVGIADGDITITSGNDGISSVYVAIYDGEINIDSDDDGIKVSANDEIVDTEILLLGGKINIEAVDDGIQSDGDVTQDGADITIISGGGSVNAAEHYDDMMFGKMGGWQGMGQHGPQFGGEEDQNGEINYDTDDDESLDDSSRNKGIKAANISLLSGSITIDSQDDAINVDGEALVEGGSYSIVAGDDGIHADYSITINGGSLEIEAWEGLEATIIEINEGDIYIYAQDDGMNAAQKVSGETPLLQINGGNIAVDMAQGDTDALDSNGNLYINGGTLNLNCQSPFDYDGSGAINGGTVYVYGEQVTEIYNQFGGGMGGFGGQGGFGGGQGGPGGGHGRP